MSRQQKKRALERRENKYKTRTYNLTESQLRKMAQDRVKEELEKHHEELVNEAVNEAMVLLLTLPLEVLMDHYWPKSYQKRIPEFTKYVLEYYEQWQNGELDMDKLKEDLWVYGGIRLEAEK